MIYIIATQDEKRFLPEDAEYIVTGVGPINVFRALNRLDKSEIIHNIGYAGSNCIKVGSRVRIGEVKTYHPNVQFKEPSFFLDGEVPCYTSGDFVEKTNIKEPCVFDMELAYIAGMGFRNLTAEKIVSDNLCLEEYEIRNEVLDGQTTHKH